MARIALKIDVDTDRGTLEGVPRLMGLFERLNVPATFLFSLGPDHTGRAVKRAFRRGFMGKVKRTSVLKHYGLKTLLYGTLLPGPHIGRRREAILRAVDSHGFEVGVHTYDHIKWQDYVARANERWTRRELTLARDEFTRIFSRAPAVHGAAGWQVNEFVPALERELGFRYASDGRGSGPFVPAVKGVPVDVPQMPTTLPTLDELIGRPDLEGADPIDHLLSLTRTDPDRDHVYTLHAELEGNTYIADFERLLRSWRDGGATLVDLAGYAATLTVSELPFCEMLEGTVEGRSGMLACQGPPGPGVE
jgi:peptidoglycan/xylan/chitin deacetylase (PgdA/CDA1 family)